MADTNGDKGFLGRVGDAAASAAYAVDTAVRTFANAVVPADKIIGAVGGVVQTVRHGGNLKDNVMAGMAGEAETTRVAAAANPHSANLGTVAGSAAAAATSGVVVAARAAQAVASVNTARLAYATHGAVSAAESATIAAADSGERVLGELAAPATPRVAAGPSQAAGRG